MVTATPRRCRRRAACPCPSRCCACRCPTCPPRRRPPAKGRPRASTSRKARTMPAWPPNPCPRFCTTTRCCPKRFVACAN
ncbi:hypothetical protein EJC49_13090 [Aquibium carbonis]|uniref:Uncharacterized protein n=1 Tax=Aquibium carbonis TaxID=2495581 RepID=A0A429YWV9_9HYPH|nr:hypothetical protein EJC49_13090 [Aquibium carbonis]